MDIETLSLGWQTDLIFARFDGTVSDSGDYLVVKTPSNPTYWWGNFLLFPRPPAEGDLPRWLAAFEAEVSEQQPESRHRAFGLDGVGDFNLPPEFLAAGFVRNEATVLTLVASQLRDPGRPLPPGMRCGPLDLPRDSASVVDAQVRSDAARFGAGYRTFAERQMVRHAAMQDAGLGRWFGVRSGAQGNAVLASCGLFRDPARAAGLGRFQYVSTDPDWRRLGLCTALVHAVCRHGFDAMKLQTLVLVADPADVAIGIYESLGFVRGASTWQLERGEAR